MPINFNINNLFKQLGKGWSLLIIFILITTAFFYFTRKTSTPDCSKCEAEKKILVDLMVEIKQDMIKLAGNDISSSLKFNSGIMIAFPYIDTLPKKRAKDSTKKKTSVPSLQQQQIQVATKVILKIDSVLRQVQQKQTKN